MHTEGLVDLIYEASLDDSLVAAMAVGIARATRSSMVAMHAERLRAREGEALFIHGVDPHLVAEYGEHYAPDNVFLRRYPPSRWHQGDVVPMDDIISDEELERSTYYNEYLRRLGVFRIAGGPIQIEPDEAVFLALGRKGRRSFAPESLQLVEELMPHLHRWLSIRRRLGTLELERDSGLQVIDRLDYGVVVLDDRGRVVVANRAAEEIARQQDGLYLSRDGLRPSYRASADEFRRLLRGARGPRLGGEPPGGALLVPRPSGKQPYQVLIAPLASRPFEPLLTSRPAAVVFVRDPERASAGPRELLERGYGLTPSEAAVAIELLGGKTVQEIAASRRVSVGTVRSQLKQIYAKTGVHRQAELVRLLSGLPESSRRVDVSD